MYGKISDPGMGIYPLRGALVFCRSAIGQWGLYFHAVRSGFDPGDYRFRRQVVGIVNAWKDL